MDAQNDFCKGGALAVPDGDDVVPAINKLRAAVPFDLVVLTQDYHPKGAHALLLLQLADTSLALLLSYLRSCILCKLSPWG